MVKNTAFCYVKPHWLVVYRRFGGKFCLKYSTLKMEAQNLFKSLAKCYQTT